MTPSCVGDPEGELLGGRGGRRVQVGRRGEHLDALPVALHRLHDRPRRGLPVRRARHLHRQLAAHRHRLLGHQRRPGAEQLRDEHRAGPVEQPHPAAVVAAADRLEHHGPAGARGQALDVRGVGDLDVLRHPPASPPSARRMTSLSWACSRASGPGWTATPSATSARSSSSGTPSWSNVTDLRAVGERAQRGEVVRAPEDAHRHRPARRDRRARPRAPAATDPARSRPGATSGRAARRRPSRRRGGGPAQV